MVCSFSGPVKTIQDGPSKNEMGGGTNSRPYDHHHLECLAIRMGGCQGEKAYLRLGIDSLTPSEDGEGNGRSGSEDARYQSRSIAAGSTYINP